MPWLVGSTWKRVMNSRAFFCWLRGIFEYAFKKSDDKATFGMVLSFMNDR